VTNSIVSTNILTTINNIAADVYLTGKTNTGAAVDFVLAQAPQVAEEFIRWHIIDNTISLSLYWGIWLLGFIVVACLYRFVKSLPEPEGRFDQTKEGILMVFWVSVVLLGLSLIPVIYESSINFKEILKAKNAPRIILIEKALKIVKK
jgi:hypothetical protein